MRRVQTATLPNSRSQTHTCAYMLVHGTVQQWQIKASQEEEVLGYLSFTYLELAYLCYSPSDCLWFASSSASSLDVHFKSISLLLLLLELDPVTLFAAYFSSSFLVPFLQIQRAVRWQK